MFVETNGDNGIDELNKSNNVSEPIEIMVQALNVVPVATDDNATTPRDTAVTLTTAQLTGNDLDLDGDALSIALVGNASNGTAALNSDGTVIFTPDAGFVGAAGFDYTVSDGQGGEDTARVDVTVEATNRAPSLDGIAAQTVEENSAVGATVLTASATDPDGDTLGYNLGGADDGAFAIDWSCGKITPAVSPDFEAQADADGARLLQERLPRWVCNDTQCGTSRCRSGSRPPNKGLTVVACLCREISMLVLRPEPRAGLILP